MASGLAEALAGVLLKPQDTGWGVGLTTLQAVAPQLVSPYASNKQNLTYGVGGALLAGLIGGMARRSADEQNRKLLAATQQLYGAKPDEISGIVDANPRLSPLASALVGARYEQAQELAQKQAEKAMDLNYKIQEEDALLPYFEQKEGIKTNFDLAKSKAMIPLEINKAAAIEDAKRKGEADFMGYNPKREEAQDAIRKEFNALSEVKNMSILEKSAKAIQGALSDDAKTSDLELTRYAILAIEPGMAVREGEQYAVVNSQALPDRWKGELQGALSGKTVLSADTREGLRRLAQRAYDSHKQQYDKALNFYRNEAKQKNLDPSRLSYIGDVPEAEKVLTGRVVTAPDGKLIRVIDE